MRLPVQLSFAAAIVILLLAAGCSPDVPTKGEESIYSSAQQGDMARVGDYVRAGFQVDTPDENGMTLLHHAALGNQVYLAEMLLEEFGADLTVQDDQGKTPFDVARESGSQGVAILLADEQ